MDFGLPMVFGLFATLWGGAPADYDATPKQLLVAVYAPPVVVGKELAPEDIYSDRLQALFDGYFSNEQTLFAAAGNVEPPINLIPFDPLSLVIESGSIAISEPVVSGHQATATVSVTKNGGTSQLSLFLIEQAEGWRIDDIASFDAEGQPWLLSWILRYDPPMDG
ncbi:MAG: hypothetical protein KKH72_02895 [Alphaproteobacteria bacterium]|nr:hypothetical protein [Alphaproteobacteria bacterium]